MRFKFKVLSGACFFLALVLLVGLVACTKPAPSPTPAAKSAPAPAATASAKPIVLKFTTHLTTPPPPPAKAQAAQRTVVWFAEEVAEKTEGRVKIENCWNSMLGAATDTLKMVGRGGIAEAGYVVSTYHEWDLPMFMGSTLPFLVTGVTLAPVAFAKIYDEWAPVRDEYAKYGLKPLWTHQMDPYWLSIKKSITKLDDLKGKKIWAGGYFAPILEKFGVSPVLIPSPEAYEALQKGVLDGIIFPIGGTRVRKFHETGCKYLVDTSFMGANCMVSWAINLDVWNKIAPADQKAIETISAKALPYFISCYMEEDKIASDYFKKAGVEMISLSPEEQTRVKDLCAGPVETDWLASCKQKGITQAEEFLKRYKAIVNRLLK